MKKINLIFITLMAVGLIAFNCAVKESGSSGGDGGGAAAVASVGSTSTSTSGGTSAETSTSSGTSSTTSSTLSSSTAITTGTVYAIYGGNAAITIKSGSYSSAVNAESADGSAKTYTFSSVPAGEVSCISVANSVTTTQTATLGAGGSVTFYVSFAYSSSSASSSSVSSSSGTSSSTSSSSGTSTSTSSSSSSSSVSSSSSSSAVTTPLTVGIYNMKSDPKSTDDMTSTTGSAMLSNEINVPVKYFHDGFPGITDKFEYFGVKYTGTLKVSTAGTYTFILVCDDGAKLTIGGNKVALTRIGSTDAYFPSNGVYAYVQEPKTIPGLKEKDGSTWLATSFANKNDNTNADSQHAPAIYKGTVYMSGSTSFELKYFQGPKDHIACFLQVGFPGSSKYSDLKAFSTSLFK
jgi:PA14 domain